ncbi:MAG: ribonuclease HI family protein [Candidatus Omnitrophica bacterium]|nr:ribonuclease HI family protein [Candidatus Omnitrophota bacterium]
MKKLTLYVDGGSRGNPGPSGIGVVILDPKGQRVKEFKKYIGIATNNIAEYNAVIYGLQEALIEKATEIELNLDSELVAQQLKGEYKVKNSNIKPLFEQALHLISGFKKVDIRHIDRAKNKEADKLVNKAINLGGLL